MRLSEHYAGDLPRLLAYELRSGETAEVIEHLRGCDECRRELVEAVADTYPPGTVLPRWFSDPPEAREASEARERRRARAQTPPGSETVFLSLVLLPCLVLIAVAALVALVKT